MIKWEEYTPTGVMAVDMCATIIVQHRALRLPIKAIHLRPVPYEQFKSWCQKNLKRELASGEQMEFDGVHIEKGDSKQASQFLIELWDEGTKKAGKNFFMNPPKAIA